MKLFVLWWLKSLRGALAEFIVADAALLAKRPTNLSVRQSGVMPLAAITAWDALHDRGHVSSGMKVLVHAGCGVGHLGVQLAKAAGAEVTTTVSSKIKLIWLVNWAPTTLSYILINLLRNMYRSTLMARVSTWFLIPLGC